jgi:Flp pilus assembly protein TadB
MAASNTFGPDEPGELSAREKKILDRIEDDMLTADPTLAHQMTPAAWPRPGGRWRAAARHGALLIAALIILIIAAAALPPTWWAVLGLLTTVLLVPWILLFPADRSHRD